MNYSSFLYNKNNIYLYHQYPEYIQESVIYSEDFEFSKTITKDFISQMIRNFESKYGKSMAPIVVRDKLDGPILANFKYHLAKAGKKYDESIHIVPASANFPELDPVKEDTIYIFVEELHKLIIKNFHYIKTVPDLYRKINYFTALLVHENYHIKQVKFLRSKGGSDLVKQVYADENASFPYGEGPLENEAFKAALNHKTLPMEIAFKKHLGHPNYKYVGLDHAVQRFNNWANDPYNDNPEKFRDEVVKDYSREVSDDDLPDWVKDSLK